MTWMSPEEEEVQRMYKLMIADDEFEIRHGLSKYFPWHTIGFEVVHAAENGTEALTYINSQPVDVLLCDIMMPDCTGIEVAEQLHSQGSNVQIILLSAHRDFEFARKALQYGVRNYILKPTEYEEIVAVFTETKHYLDNLVSQQPSETTAHSGAETSIYTAEAAHDPVIQKILDYLEQEYKDATLEGASLVVHMNPSYISKYFKKMTGTNFSEYLNEVRMKKAAEILRLQKYKIYEISEMIGYQNAQNFARSFKRHFGQSPYSYINDHH
ncbi:putative response regulatory protein [compost metagenome]